MKLLTLNSKQIVNQQRFPINKFGWLLKDVSNLIIDKKENWEEKSKNEIERFIELRKSMLSFKDLYGLKELSKWPINYSFVPWFSDKPKKNILDLDFTELIEVNQIFQKLIKLIDSISKNYIVSKKRSENITVYPFINSNKYYVRKGNHRAAILSALGKNIPCVLDDINDLKPRALDLISHRIFKFGPKSVYKEYPVIKSFKNWPAVKNKIMSENNAKEIYALFSN